MIIHAGSRYSGKTTKAIIMAASTKSLLLTPNSTMADYIRKTANDMGYHVETVSIQHYLEYKQHYRGRKLVIDELDTVLREAFGGDVIMATTTGATMEHGFSFINKVDKVHGR